VNVLEKIRNEEKFSSSEELINQMNKDKEAGMKIFNEINNSRNLNTFKN
jgi:FAD synthase